MASRRIPALFKVALVDGQSAIVECSSENPLHLFTPRSRGRVAWAIAATYGGGLVAGDQVALDIEVGPGASALLGTQSFNKVYRSDGRWAEQHLKARVAAGGILAVLPEPTSCFSGARYRQEQQFDLDAQASLLLLDAVSAGRSAREERWAFADYRSCNRTLTGGRPAVFDAIRLSANEGMPLVQKMREIEFFATLFIVGPAFVQLARVLLDEVGRMPALPGTEILAAASPVSDGVHLRVASRSVEAGQIFVRSKLAPAGEALGDNPFDRRP